jgi:WD40 repeat protein
MASTPLSNQDVREMIPEFYFLPDFLSKPDGLDLGQLQDGTRLGNVELPPWASGSSLKFIALHRQALESAYVSAHLHNWIDLVFGEKQQGPKAEEAVNVFVHLTYDGKVDIDQISDPLIKASTLAQIREFGQTPRQVTKKSHEAKKPIEPRFSILNSSPNLLCTHLKDTGLCIGDAAYSVERNVAAIGSSERVLHAAASYLILKASSARRFFWGASDGCLRLYEGDIGQRHVAAWQSLHQGRVLVAASSHDGTLVATGSSDGVIMVWHADHSKELAPMRLKARRVCVFSPPSPSLFFVFFCVLFCFALFDLFSPSSLIGHYAPITALAISSIWDVVVSSSSNGSVIVWDLNSVSPINVISSLSVAASSISIGDW